MTTPIPIPAAPPIPTSTSPEATFDAMWEAFNTYIKNDLVPGLNRETAGVHGNAQAAESASSDASAARDAAANHAQAAAEAAQAAGEASGATAWSASTAYTVGDRVFITGGSGGLTFRRQTNGTSATPPDQDGTNWATVVSPATTPVVTSTSADNGVPLAPNTTYKLQAATAYSRALPATPADGAVIEFINSNQQWTGLFTLTRGNGAHTINGLADNLNFNTNRAKRVRAQFSAPSLWIVTAQ